MWPSPAAAPALVDVAGDTVPVHRFAVLAWEQQRVAGGDVRGPVGVDELHDARVQRQVAVFVELADGHVQPVGVTDQHDGVGGQGGVLPDP
jgi:hypothetical protein